MLRWCIFAWVASVALIGCASGANDPSDGPSGAREVTRIVARVGGRPIGASEVEARMEADGVDAHAALDMLIEEDVLAQEAARAGFTIRSEDQRTIERLMVRSMLRDFEAELTPESISDEEVAEDFEKHGDKLQVLERRDSWHILVREASDSGRTLADSILREIRRSEDPVTVYERYSGKRAPETAFDLKTEDLPAITMKANIEEPYKIALFAAKSEGPLKSPVKTSFGWHAIVLTEIIPGERKTLEDLDSEIRERLSQKKRFEKLARTVEGLEARGLVDYEEAGVERLLSMAGLPERQSE